MKIKLLTISCVSLALWGCSGIEHRSETVQKKPLEPLVEQQAKLSIQNQWAQSIGSGVGQKDPLLQLADAGDSVVAADHQGRVSRVSKNNGKTLWQVNTRQSISAGPSVGEDRVLLATSDGKILALRLKDGRQEWEQSVHSEVLAAPAIDNDAVFVRTLDGNLITLNLEDGRQLWRYAVNTPTLLLRRSGSPVVTDSRVIAGFSSGKLVSFQRMDGSVEWAQDIALPKGHTEVERMVDLSAEPLVKDDVVYAVTYQGKLAAVSVDTGYVIWERDISSFTGLAIDGDVLYVASTDGEILAIDREAGGTLWKQSALQGRRLSRPVVQNNHVVVGDEEGLLHWLRLDNGQLVARLQADPRGIEAQPIVDDHRLFALGKSGKLIAVDVRQKRIAGTQNTQNQS